MTDISIIKNALKEDTVAQDITTQLLIPKNHLSTGFIVAKETGVICGVQIAKKVFQAVDTSLKVQILQKDGKKCSKGAKIISIKGKTAPILKAERTALNFLGHLSGIATQTNIFVKKIKPFKAQILDTRKTTPGLRHLEKYAVKCGGGVNHRMDLSEMVMIKDNHRALYKTNDLKVIINSVKKKTKKKIIVEVDNLKEFKQVLEANPYVILLDNMKHAQMKKAVILCKKSKTKTLLEASGGVNLNTVKKIAQTGVNRISIGALTHCVKSINFSLDIQI